MRPRTDSQVAPWFAKREEDLALMSLALERAPHLRDAICFHAQQAAEKSLKALLAAVERDPPWIHDLVLLLRSAREAVPDLGVAPEDCEILTPFATLTRYPRRTAADAAPLEVAVAASRRIVAAVDAAFDLSQPPAG